MSRITCIIEGQFIKQLHCFPCQNWGAAKWRQLNPWCNIYRMFAPENTFLRLSQDRSYDHPRQDIATMLIRQATIKKWWTQPGSRHWRKGQNFQRDTGLSGVKFPARYRFIRREISFPPVVHFHIEGFRLDNIWILSKIQIFLQHFEIKVKYLSVIPFWNQLIM